MARSYYGRVQVGGTITMMFSTNDSNGASITMTPDPPTVQVYKNSSLTESTSGVTVDVDFDSITGVHHVEIDTSANSTFYTSGDMFHVVLNGATVDSQTVNHLVGSFAIGQIVGVGTSAADNADVVSLVNRALNFLGEDPITSLADGTKRADAANLVYVPARDSVLEMHLWKTARKLATLTQDNTFTLSVATWSGGTATLTADGHDIAVDDSVTVAGVTPDGYNGTYTVTGVSGSTFDYALTTDPGAGTAFGTVLNPLTPNWKYSRQFSLPSDFMRLIRIEDEGYDYEIHVDKMLTDMSAVKMEYVYRQTTVSEMNPMLREAIAAKVAHELSYRLDTSSKKQADMLALFDRTMALARNVDASQRPDDSVQTDTWLRGRLSGESLYRKISSAT